MPFKLISQITIDNDKNLPKTNHHFVWSREKCLHPGDIVLTKGSVAMDVEAKSWDGADVSIKVSDDDNLDITWKQERPELWYRLLSPGWASVGFKGPVEIRKSGKEFMDSMRSEFGRIDLYYCIDEYNLPEVFTPLDRLWLPYWEWSKIISLKGFKDIKRKTRLEYNEPTLPAQSRK